MAKKKDDNFTPEEMEDLGIIENQVSFEDFEKESKSEEKKAESKKVQNLSEEISKNEEVNDDNLNDEDDNFETDETESEADEDSNEEIKSVDDEESVIKPKGKITKRKQEPSYTSLLNGQDGSGVVSKSLEQVIHESMMPYSEYVILDRALPRVEDGLKPVQRRVLYSMLEVGVTPDKPYRKSATIVGNCMGKYHPHGDSSIYLTMVRLAQDFNMGVCLVDGHGNFGSVDGDPPAAMRYTESRLSPISMELLKDIEKNTVTWSLNFDDSRKEPDMLPGRFPNLLVNGATGIAVGLATSIPTHNLAETIDCVTAYIDNPKIKLKELLKFMPAPDFSTGGYILNSSNFEEVYGTGKGKIVIRAKLHVEQADNGKKNIVITEIPYGVNKASMLQKIDKLKESDTTNVLNGISEIVDESDRHGLRAVIKLKKDANVKAILKYLYNKSDLQTNFNVNMVAIAEGKPKLLSLLEIISYYVKYQRNVVYNRTKFDLDAAEKRKHILDGLLIAIKNIDAVIKIIKTSKSTVEAKQRLIEKFYLSDVQAQAILDMRLARLTSLEVNKLVNELENLIKLIAELKSILESEKKLMNVVKKELIQIKKTYGTPRKTEIISDEQDERVEQENENEVMVEAEEVFVVCSPENTLKVLNKKTYNMSTKVLSSNPTKFEIPVKTLLMQNNKNLYLFTNLGNCHKIKVSQIPYAKLKDKGTPVASLVKNFLPQEKIVAMFDFNETDEETELIFATKQGLIKISKQSEYISSKQSISAIKLKDNDEVVFVGYDNREKSLLMFSHDGMAVNIIKDDVACLGRVSAGVKGMTLNANDYVVNCVLSGALAYTIFTSNGFGKVIKENEIALSGRARKGVKVISGKKLDIKLIGAYELSKTKNFVAILENDTLNYVESKKLVLENRLGQGKSVVGNKNGESTKLVVPYVIGEN